METEKFECIAAQALVGRFLAGDNLPEEQQKELETHLAGCPDCTNLLEEKKAELLRELSAEPATPSPATADPLPDVDDNAVLTPDQIAAMMEAANAAPSDPLPDVDDNAVLTPDQIAAMMEAANAEPADPLPDVDDNAVLTPDQIAAMMEAANAEPAPSDGIELVFDEEELPSAAPMQAAPEPAPAPAPVPAKPAAKSFDVNEDILAQGLDADHLDALLADIPVPVAPVIEVAEVAPEPTDEAAAIVAKEETAAPIEATEEPAAETDAPEKKKIKIRVEGLPILLGKNLKTMAYSASLGLVLVAMTTFAKNPSTLFGDRALAANHGATHGTEKKADEHTEKPVEKEPDVKEDTHHAEEPTPKVEEHSEEPVTKADEHAAEEHPKPTPEENPEDEAAALKERMDKFKSNAEREADKEKEAEHTEPKTAAKPAPTPRVSQEDSYMVARPHDDHHAQPTVKKTAPRRPTMRVTNARPKPRPTAKRTSTTTTRKKPAATPVKKPSGGLKIYDENGNPIN